MSFTCCEPAMLTVVSLVDLIHCNFPPGRRMMQWAGKYCCFGQAWLLNSTNLNDQLLCVLLCLDSIFFDIIAKHKLLSLLHEKIDVWTSGSPDNIFQDIEMLQRRFEQEFLIVAFWSWMPQSYENVKQECMFVVHRRTRHPSMTAFNQSK